MLTLITVVQIFGVFCSLVFSVAASWYYLKHEVSFKHCCLTWLAFLWCVAVGGWTVYLCKNDSFFAYCSFGIQCLAALVCYLYLWITKNRQIDVFSNMRM